MHWFEATVHDPCKLSTNICEVQYNRCNCNKYKFVHLLKSVLHLLIDQFILYCIYILYYITQDINSKYKLLSCLLYVYFRLAKVNTMEEPVD